MQDRQEQEDFGIWNCDEDWQKLNWNQDSVLAVPGRPTDQTIDGVDQKGDNQCKVGVSDFKGKFLVIVFYKSNSSSKSFLAAFSDLADLFRSNKAEVVGCSNDSISDHSSWLKGSWAGGCKLPLWSDPTGNFANRFDLWDDEGFCRNGVVIVDDAGLVRHAMTSALEPTDTAKSTLEIVGALKKSKVDLKSIPKPQSSSSKGGRALSPVTIDRAALEQDWDVSDDPELLKVLSKAKLLGKTKPLPKAPRAKAPMFNLTPDDIRKLKNPRRGAPVRWCSATLHRNLTGFGQSGDIPTDKKVKLENLIKKVMGVAYMPEDLTGKFTSMAQLNQREQTKFLENDLFLMTGDAWMKEPGSVEWSQGKGVFINNYRNFILWVGLEDQLKFVSLAKGTDLKYVLLRLQKAVARIEEALKMVFSTKSCNERGFATNSGEFVHCKRGVYGTGFETTFTVDLPGLARAENKEMDKAKNDLFVDIEKGRSGSIYTVSLRQSPDYDEEDIVTRSVEAVEGLWKLDMELQAKFGIKLDQTGRSL